MQGTNIRAAFVSTNSITQGEQVAGVWKPLYERFRVHVDFVYRTFRCDSKANMKAHVHCVIVGFSCATTDKPKRLFEGDTMKYVQKICVNAHLLWWEIQYILLKMLHCIISVYVVTDEIEQTVGEEEFQQYIDAVESGIIEIGNWDSEPSPQLVTVDELE